MPRRLTRFRAWPRGKKLSFIGIVIAAVGLFLFLGFWPLFSANGGVLTLARQNSDVYHGYTVGQQVLFRGTVLNVTFSGCDSSGCYTILYMDAGDTLAPWFELAVKGDARGAVTPGSVIFVTAVLKDEVIIGHYYQYWQVASPSDIHPAWPVDATFAATALVGFGLFLAGAIVARKPRR